VTRLRQRRGIALIAALALMTLLAILVVGGVASSTLAQRASNLSHTDALLTAAADFAITTVLAEPDRFGLAQLPLGQPSPVDVAIDGSPGVHATVVATRLPASVLWLVAEVSMGGLDQGRRRVNVVASFPSLGTEAPAAIVARGSVRIGAGVLFSSDTIGDADCRGRAEPDVVIQPGAAFSTADSVHVSRNELAADSSTYHFGEPQLAGLRGPTVVRVGGDTTISGGEFDGILLVDGSVAIAGPFRMRGLLIARGRIDARAGGLVVNGAMLSYAPQSSGVWSVDIASASITFSRCATQWAVRSAFGPRAVAERGWAELF
jgi:hypothetical protein